MLLKALRSWMFNATEQIHYRSLSYKIAAQCHIVQRCKAMQLKLIGSTPPYQVQERSQTKKKLNKKGIFCAIILEKSTFVPPGPSLKQLCAIFSFFF